MNFYCWVAQGATKLSDDDTETLYDTLAEAVENSPEDPELFDLLKFTSEVVAAKGRAQAVLERALAALPDKTYLAYIGYDEELSDGQIHHILTEEGWPDDLLEFIDESSWTGENYVVDEVLNESERRLLDDAELMDKLIDAIRERDASTPIDNITRRTPAKLFRYNLGVDVTTGWDASDEEIEEQVQGIADAIGLHDQDDAIKAILREASSGGVACIYWQGDVEDILDASQGARFNDKKFTITWTNPSLLVLNSMDGSGMDGSLAGTVTLPFDPERLKLDARNIGNGYSWDEVAGIVPSAYRTDCTITEVKVTES